MKGFIVSSLALISLTALSACAPYNWAKDYGNGQVTLDGPLRKNITYVKGSTSFANATPAGMAMPTQMQMPMQIPAQASAFAMPTTGVTNAARSIIAPVTMQAPAMQVPVSAVRTTIVSPMMRQQVPMATPQATAIKVPPAFINGGQSANLQTRRVGDAGIVVFSNMIEESVAQSAASRSCAQEGKAASPTAAVDVATGVKQLNFNCL